MAQGPTGWGACALPPVGHGSLSELEAEERHGKPWVLESPCCTVRLF